MAWPALAQSCTASATSTSFGVHNPLSALPHDATGRVTLTCGAFPVALVLGYSITLSAGESGVFAQRRMSAGAHMLRYQLYADPLRTAVWGDGSAGTQTVGGLLALGLLGPVSIPHTVYGRIPGSQNSAAAGAYGDVVTVTVTY